MSRHRYYRNLDLDEAYEDAYDDSVYGRSVDDDVVSPSSHQYMYSHAHGQHDAFSLKEDGITEEGYDNYQEEVEPEPYQKPQLSEEDECRLQSVLDQLRNVMGNSVTEAEMTTTVLITNFDVERSLDKLLNRQTQENQLPSTVPAGTGRTKRSKNKKPAGTAATGGSQHQRQQNPDSSNKVAATELRAKGPAAVTKVTTPAAKVVRGFQVQQETGAASRDCSPYPEDDARLSPAPTKQARPAVRLPVRQRDKAVDVSNLYEVSYGGTGGRQLLNLVVVGHVDAGKSTLTGHLLYNQGNVSKKVMHKYEQESKKTGKQTAYAWVMDDTEEERIRGVTVDVAERSFETISKLINILDAPGHKDFIPNMISGAARADVALLVVDASTGEFEAGFENSGQTREHAMLIKSLGVSQVAVAVNKLDTVNWSQDRFNQIKTALSTFLKTVGYRSSEVTYVPCSGLTGENLTSGPTQQELLKWYSGPSILQAIDSMQCPEREVCLPTRFSVGDVFKGASGNMCVTGKLHTGYVKLGDKLVLMPLMLPLTVKDIVSGSGAPGELFAGNSGTLTVSGAELDELTVGSFLCDPAKLMQQVTALQARIVVFNIMVPLIKGAQVELHHQALCEPATIRRLVSQINKTTGEVIKQKPRVLAKQSAGVVELELARPVCLETYKQSKELGRFMLRQQGNTVAAGLVTEILSCRAGAGDC